LEKIFISGGVPLSGTVRVSGSKNSSLAIITASLLARRGKTVLRNIPRITDIFTMVDMLQRIGAVVEVKGSDTLTIDATDFSVPEAPYELVKRMRASFCVLGPMIARLGSARVPLPGGCDIGARPVDFHVKGLQALGAHVTIGHGYVDAEADELVGNHIYLDFPSAGATTHLITAAALARGITTIENAAAEPEVVDLARFLTAMGARIEGAGTKKVVIEGVEELNAVEHTVIPDRIEAGTFAIIGSQPGGEIVLENVIAEHLQPVLSKLQETGVDLTFLSEGPDSRGCLRVSAARRLKAVDILAMPHPGFPTDLQQPMAALLATAEGTSVVTDHVFESRFKFGSELQRMGADIRVEGRTAILRGVPLLSGAEVVASDLRAGGALIVAALGAAGETVLTGLEHVDRGYESIVEKLEGLGADIVRYDPDRQPMQLCAV
jgi:UDP-N-acetylglucosamine 1-carboxyvinyltransferase